MDDTVASMTDIVNAMRGGVNLMLVCHRLYGRAEGATVCILCTCTCVHTCTAYELLVQYIQATARS